MVKIVTKFYLKHEPYYHCRLQNSVREYFYQIVGNARIAALQQGIIPIFAPISQCLSLCAQPPDQTKNGRDQIFGKHPP